MFFPLALYTVRQLKPTFFKVVDMSGQYRPLVYETMEDKWPVPNASCPPNAGPYDTVHEIKCREIKCRRRLQFPEPSSPPPAAKRKSGYCECCSIRYQDLEMVCKRVVTRIVC